MAQQSELLRGTLDLLILKALMLGPRHGLGVARRVEQLTGGTFQVKPGSLFPALHRLEQDGWIEGEWETPPKGRRVKSYRLTREGRRHLSAEKATWQRVVTAMSLVLESSS